MPRGVTLRERESEKNEIFSLDVSPRYNVWGGNKERRRPLRNRGFNFFVKSGRGGQGSTYVFFLSTDL